MLDAWGGSLAYSLQLYFDFSGYSEMAIGLGLLFNYNLPLNFNLPYRATSIIDFWRRWHMTLSAFLKNYLYIPLGGNRNWNHMRNILITMFLGGLWHGAGWTFIFWGVLHGTFICINHLWRKTKIVLPKFLCWLLTFNAVNIAWIFFRANNFESAMNILRAMFDVSNIVIPYNKHLAKWFDIFAKDMTILSFSEMINIALAIVVSIIIFDKKRLEQINIYVSTLVVTVLFLYAVLSMCRVTEFLYFQF